MENYLLTKNIILVLGKALKDKDKLLKVLSEDDDGKLIKTIETKLKMYFSFNKFDEYFVKKKS